jgi:ribonuclease P protein component
MKAKYRLRRSADFRRVYGTRRRREGRLLAVHIADGGSDGPRVGFSVSTKVGGAVTRNLVRRRLRDSSRAILDGIETPLDVVVVARPGAASASFAELDAELRELIGKLVSL